MGTVGGSGGLGERGRGQGAQGAGRRASVLGVNLHGVKHAQGTLGGRPGARWCGVLQQLAGLGVEVTLIRSGKTRLSRARVCGRTRGGRILGRGILPQALPQRLTQSCGTLGGRRVGAGRLHSLGASRIQLLLRANPAVRRLPRAPLAALHGLGGTLHPVERLRVALLKAGVLLGGALGLLAALL